MAHRTYCAWRMIGIFFVIAGCFLAAGRLAQADGPAPAETNQPVLLAPLACNSQGTGFRTTLTAVQDSYIKSSSPTTNYGTATNMMVGIVTLPSTATYRALVSFDLATLPADAEILTATLELYQNTSASFSIQAQALTSAWVETAVTWNDQPSSTTTDEAAEGIANGYWRRWDLTSMAQKWHAGTLTNHGVRLVFDLGLNGTKSFSSHEGDNPPRLVVEYLRRATLEVQADTQVRQASPTSNFGGSSPLYVVRDGVTASETHALLRFDLSFIPAGSAVTSASLGLFPYFARAEAPANTQSFSIASEAVLETWSEMTVTWTSVPDSAGQGDPPLAWSDTVWNWFDVTNSAQNWVSGALVNHGIKLKPAVGSTGSAVFEALPSSRRAQLIITYGPPPCYAAASVNIGGATQGITDTDYTFNTVIQPTNATAPITYTWQSPGQSSVSGPDSTVTYRWATAGWKTITVTVENCDSSVMDTHQISITVPAPACPIPLTELLLSGPTEGITETLYTFSAGATPVGATEPVIYTWQADDQTPYTGSQATQSYAWDAPGTKQITVTAENCGGTFVQYHTIDVIPLSQLPDLTVSGLWYNQAEERVYYVIQNVGESAAPAGQTVSLYKDGDMVSLGTFNETLQPNWTRAGSIPYNWSCTAAAAQVRACADAGDTILEAGEANNCFQETWSCDLVSPQITSGPTVSEKTEHTAVISWTTDEACHSQLDYGRSGPFNALSVSNNTPRTDHTMTLTGLDSGSLYWFQVLVTDEAENLTNSSNLFFETQPSGTDPVTIGTAYGLLDHPSTWYDFYTLYADVTSEPAGVERVSFFLDGQLVGRDYTADGNRFEVYVSPAAMGMSRSAWFTDHTLQIQAYNLEGEVTAVTKTVTPSPGSSTGSARFVSPNPDQQVLIDGSPAPSGTTLDVLAYAVGYEWKCTDGGIEDPAQVPPGLQGVDCGDVRQNVNRMKLYLDSIQVSDTFYPPDGAFHHTFSVDLAGKTAGRHTLRLVAQAGTDSYQTEREIVLVQGRGDLDFDRRVTRENNVFQVTLTISNTGTGTVYIDYVDDFARGFQVVETASQHARTSTIASTLAYNYYTITSNDWGDLPERSIRIDLYADGNPTEMILPPGGAFTIEYQLVPILYPQWEFYYIGSGHDPSQTAWIYYRLLGVPGTFVENLQASGNWVGGTGTDDGVLIDVAVQQAAASADYLLITSPAGLRHLTTPIGWRTSDTTQRELSLVLSRMAELGALQSGVLGFLPLNPSDSTLDALLEPGGRWANAMHPNFRTYDANGYVLLVGEQEIIPAQAAGYGVNYSDLRYASTSGEAKPELVLGRVVGDDLGTLSNALRTSILFHRSGFGFDRSHALGLSGRGRGESVFWDDVKATANRLANSGGYEVTKIRAKTTDPETWTVFQDSVATLHPDLIFYSGHGNPDSWYSVGSAAPPQLDFGTTRPIGVAFACSTGNYEDPGDDDYGMPESWLRYDGSVYIGSSDTSYDYPDSDAIRAFADYWSLSVQDRNIGQVLTYLKRCKWGNDSDWKLFAYEYHLFGDPKYGAMTSRAPQVLAPVVAQAVTTLEVTIPDYEVTTTTDNLDAVEIPGGEMWIEEGAFRIPFWHVTLDYPQGQRVQDVTLTAQAGLVVTTGLNLPTTTLGIRCPSCGTAAAAAVLTTDPGWVPGRAQPYDWQVIENPDGTSTLELSIYPFSYYSPTTTARFYRDWSFELDVFSNTVDIQSLVSAQATYLLTETVTAAMVVHNSGEEQPIIVQPVIQSLSGETVAALPLQALHAVSGNAMVDLAVPILAAGDYYLQVTLLDMTGHTLDTEITEFSVGVVACQVTELTATPTLFQAGNMVDIAMTIGNTGDLMLDAIAVIRVETSDGMHRTAEFTHTITALAPGATLVLENTWDSAAALDGADYRVVGYVKYAGTISAPAEVNLSTRGRIYLPLLVRSAR